MASRHTFHTPSFGDEEFELPQLHHNSLLIGGDSHTYDMSTISASDSASISNYSHSQWPASHQTDHIKPDSVTLTGNEFLVLRSPPQHEANVSGGTAMADQTISSDESDDNGMKPDAKHDNRLKHKRDPNAPQKPPAAYALFFRDTQAAIKGQNPSASFDEVSTIVASMWDVLDPEHKNVYKKKAEDAKREYRKSLSAYRANVIAKNEELPPPRVEKPPAPVAQPVPIANTTPLAGNYNSSSQQVPTSAPVQPAHNVDEVAEHPIEPAIVSEQMCVRNGCPNQAIVSIDWEDEYCSNECVITHCRDIFSRWVQDISAAPESYQAT